MLRRFSRQGLPIKFVQHGLRIEAIRLPKPAIHEKKNDMFGLWLEMGVLDHPGSRTFRRLGQGLTHKAGKAQHAKPGAHLAERFTAGNLAWRRNMKHKSSPNVSPCRPSGIPTLFDK